MTASTVDQISEKTCSGCGLEKPLSEFYPKARGAVYRGAAGFNSKCKPCIKVENAARNTNGVRLKECYGITLEQWNEMFFNQNGCCAVCMRHQNESPKKRLHVDHDHANGKVRGLLCGPCNMAIGLLKDDPHVMSRAIDYLRAAKVASTEEAG